MTLIILTSIAWPLFWLYKHGSTLNSDSITHVQYALGRTPASPHHTRLLPAMLLRVAKRPSWGVFSSPGRAGIEMDDLSRHAITAFGVVCTQAALLVIGLKYGLAATFLLGASPLVRIHCCSILGQPDQLALLLAALALWLPAPWCYVATGVAGVTHERVPPIVAAITMDYVHLIGVAVWGVARLAIKAGSANEWDAVVLNHKFLSARSHVSKLGVYLMVAVVGVFWLGFRVEAGVVLAVLLAYGQMFIAVDRTKLYSWAVLALLPGTVESLGMLPIGWAALLAIGLLGVSHWAAERSGI